MSIRELKAGIIEVKEEFLVIGIIEENMKKIIEKKKIKFRGFPATKSLINSSTFIIEKLENKNIIEASVDPETEINAFFGIIKNFNPLLQTIVVYDFENSFDCLANNLFFMNGSKVPLDHISNHIESPVVAYFKSNLFLEAKVIEKGNILTLSFDFVEDNHHDYVFLKDEQQIIHTIPRDKVFFNGTNQCLTFDDIKELIGKKVQVFIKDGKLRAEIASLPKQMYQEVSVESDNYMKFQTCNVKEDIHKGMLQNEESKNKIDDDYSTIRSGSIFNFKRNIPINHNSLKKLKVTNEIVPLYSIRHHFNDFCPLNLSWYYKPNQQFKKASWTIFIGLCESTYRFPDSYLRQALKSSLIKNMNSFGQTNYEQYFEWLVSLGETKNESSLEELHLYLNQYTELYNDYADIIIGEIDFQKLSEEYHVCFNIYKGQFSSLENIFIQPISFEEHYPVISLYFDTIFYLIYSDLVMKYDGFNLKTLQIGYKNNIQLDWPLIYKPEKKSAIFYSLLSSIAEIQQYIKSPNRVELLNFKDSNKKLVKNIEACKDILDIKCPRILNLIEEIKDSKIEELEIKIKCKCGELCDGTIKCDYCGDLCSKCELCAIRIEYCLYCKSRLNDTNNEYLIMCDRCNKLEKNTDVIGFCCRCIICRRCIVEIYSLGNCYCERDFDNNDDYYINTFLNE